VDPDVDIVGVALPPDLQPPVVLQAISGQACWRSSRWRRRTGMPWRWEERRRGCDAGGGQNGR
jgi:hypothetical protein